MPREQQIGYRLYVRDEATGKLTALAAKFRAVGQSGSTAMRDVDTESKKVTKELSQLDRTLGRLQRTIVAFAGVWAFREASRGLTSLVKTGLEYNKMLEQTKIGIAAVLAANYGAEDATRKLNLAQKEAIKIIADLREANLRTAATFPQLITMFQQALPHALERGFSVRQIEEFVTAMSQAATSMGIPLNMMAEEMRAMLKGTITAKNTLIAVALGMDKAVIKSLRGTQLFDYLMEKLRAFQASSQDIQRSWQGVMTNMRQALEQTLGEAFKYLYDDIKRTGEALTEFFKSEQFKKDMADLAANMRTLLAGLRGIFDLYRQLPDDVVKAGGLGLVGRILFGSWGPAKIILGVTLINDLFKQLNRVVPGNVFPAFSTEKMMEDWKELTRAINELFEVATGRRHWNTGAQIVRMKIKPVFGPFDIKQQLPPLRLDQHEHAQALRNLQATFYEVTEDINEKWRKAHEDMAAKAKAAYLADLEAFRYAHNIKGEIEVEQYEKGLETWKEVQDEMAQIGNEVWDAYVANQTQALQNEQIVVREHFDNIINLAQHTAEQMQDAFSNYFFDVMQGRFEDFGDYVNGFLTSIQRSIANVMGQMFIQGAGELLGGALMGGGLFFHKGGIVGATPAPVGLLPASTFAGAPKLHSGLSADEFPAILQRGETVLPRGVAPASQTNVFIIANDAKSFADLMRQNKAVVTEVTIEDLRKNGALLKTLRGLL